MTKDNLLSTINEAINEGIKKQTDTKIPFLYKTAISLLEEMKKQVLSNASPAKPQNIADSIDLFGSKEVDNYDKEYGSTLCKVSRSYESYYNIKFS